MWLVGTVLDNVALDHQFTSGKGLGDLCLY